MSQWRFASLCFSALVVVSPSVAGSEALSSIGADPDDIYQRAETLRLAYEKRANLDAIELYGESLALWLRVGDYANAALAASGRGTTYEQLGEIEKATGSYAEAVRLSEKAGSGLLESNQRSVFGVSQALLGDSETAWDIAEQQCRKALELAGSFAGARARALNCLGQVSYARGHRQAAIESHRSAKALLVPELHPRVLAETLLLLGYVHSDMRQFKAAAGELDRAMTLWQSLGDKRGAALTLVAIARMQTRQADHQPALAQFHQASALFEQMGDVVDLASCYTGMAGIYMDMGQYQNSKRFLELALTLFEQAGLDNYVPDVLPWLGLAELSLGEHRVALVHLERALEMSERSGNRRWSARALRHLGYAHHTLGDPQAALEYLLRLEKFVEIVEDPQLSGWLLNDIGSVYVILGDFEKAESYFARGLERNRRIDDRAGEARALFGMAQTRDGMGRLDSAIDVLERALELTESLRAEVASQEMRASYLASVHEFYQLHVSLLMKAHSLDPDGGFAEAAFQASERARARSLIEKLVTTGVDLQKGVDPAALTEEQQIREALNTLYQTRVMLVDGPESRLRRRDLESEILDLEARYHLAQARTNLSNPRYAALSQPRPVSLRQVQKELLDEETVLLEYSLGEARSYLWLVSEQAYSVHELPGRAEIDRLARSMYAAVSTKPGQRRADHQDNLKVARTLSDILLKPVVAELAGKRILVVAAGSLHYVPFGALPAPGNTAGEPVPMMLRHELVTVPSMSTLAVIRAETEGRKPAPKGLAVLFDPVYGKDDPRLSAPRVSLLTGGSDRSGSVRSSSRTRDGLSRLSHTGVEAELIARPFGPGEVLKVSGFAADRAFVFRPDLSRYRLVHFATHATFHENEPGLSGLILASVDEHGVPKDGFLRLHDIYQLHLPAELVVLSACNTALGEHIAGEGLVGIVRGFMYAGSKRVVASLWRVEDRATSVLMGRFYQEMLGEGRSVADALRHAQMFMWRQARWRDPFYWAAFTVQGDWSSN